MLLDFLLDAAYTLCQPVVDVFYELLVRLETRVDFGYCGLLAVVELFSLPLNCFVSFPDGFFHRM